MSLKHTERDGNYEKSDESIKTNAASKRQLYRGALACSPAFIHQQRRQQPSAEGQRGQDQPDLQRQSFCQRLVQPCPGCARLRGHRRQTVL